MKIQGSSRIAAFREKVWERLLDPQVLARSLPGCEKFEANPDGSYAAEMRIGVAAIKGTYKGRVEILDAVPPDHFRLKIEGKGTGGFLTGEGTLTLVADGAATWINYAGEAQVGGLVASVGQRLVLLAAKQITAQFFEAFAREFS
jgi:uncharacterized protein